MNKEEFKANCRKIWDFLWHDNGFWSWIANVAIAFVLIKFIVYPVLGFALGTTHPIVAVVSGSMEHDGSFDAWWNEKCCAGGACVESPAEKYPSIGVSEDQFQGFRFKNGFNKGDLMILAGTDSINVGDVVVFMNPQFSDPIIHRVVARSDSVFTTKGDHNCASASFETNIPKDRFIGKAVVRIPFLGWIKVGFVSLVQSARQLAGL